MITNPLSRKPKSPVEQAVAAFDEVRSEAAERAATIRDAAADVAETLTEIGPPAPKRKLPVLAAAAAAALGVAYFVRSRLTRSAPGPAAEVPGPPAAAATAARTTAPPPPAGDETPTTPGANEEPKDPKAATAESAAGGAGSTAEKQT